MVKPRISVVTPCLNQVRFVERTICSVLDQGYAELEYIVVDRGSTDGSIELIGLYENEFRYWFSGGHQNHADAINRGVSRASGDIVCVLGGDKLMLPGALDTVATLMGGENGHPWLAGRCLRISEQDKITGCDDAMMPASLASFFLQESGRLPSTATFYARECFDRWGPFAADLPMACVFEFNCRLMAGGHRPRVIGTALAARRTRSGTTAKHQGQARQIEQWQAAIRYARLLPVAQRVKLWSNLQRAAREAGLPLVA